MSKQTAAVVGRVLLAAGEAAVSDRDLLRRFADTNDQAAFAALVRRHTGMVLGVCRRTLTNPQDAEDACQATFLVLAQKAKGGRWQPSLANWLYTTARKVAHNARVATQRRAKREGRAAVPEAVEPVDAMTGREFLAALDEELDRLPLRYREPLVLCYLEGLTRDEAARRLGVPAATLKAQLERGRKRLAESLTRRGCVLGAGLLALAATSPAGASPPRLVEAVLAAAAGSPPAAVALLVKGVAVNGVVNKSLCTGLLVAGVAALSIGVGSVAPTAVGPPLAKPATATASGLMRAPDEKPAPHDSKEVAVSGRVLDPDGKPVAGAKLLLVGDRNAAPAPQPATGPDGRFAFTLPPPEFWHIPWHIVASAPGCGMEWISVAEPQRDVTLRLTPDIPILGRLIDLQGKPVVGATVAVKNVFTGPPGTFETMLANWKKSADEQEHAARRLDRSIYNQASLKQAFRTTSAADGSFTLSGFGKDRVVTLLVSGTGLADTYAAVATRPGFDPAGAPRTPLRLYPLAFTLAVAPDKPITGVVRDAQTKAPLAGVWVSGETVVENFPRGIWLFHAWPVAETTTGADGRFTLRGLAKSGRYALVADPGAARPHLYRSFEVPDTEGFAPAPADVELLRGIVVTGRVTNSATGAGVRSQVDYQPLEQNEFLPRFPGYGSPGRRTDAGGRYTVTVIPGAGLLLARPLRGGLDPTDYLLTRATDQDIADGIVDKQGIFRTAGPGGIFTPDAVNAFRVIRPAAADQTATLDLAVRPGASRIVKVVDADGQSVAGTAAAGIRPRGAITRPPTTAEFTVTGLDPDHPRRVLFFHAERKLSGAALIDGKGTDPIVVTLEPLGAITGRLLNQDGTPATGRNVTFWIPEGDVSGFSGLRHKDRPLVVTDADGRFRLDDLPHGLPISVGATKPRDGKLTHLKEQVNIKPGEVHDVGALKAIP